jgi:hypothetical protein
LLREKRHHVLIGHLAMMRVTEPIHRGLRRQIGHGLRQPWGHKQLALLRRLPTDKALLLAGTAAAEGHQDHLFHTGRVICFRQQSLGIRMQLGSMRTPAATPGHD